MQSMHKSVDTKSRKICSVPQCSSYCTKDVSLHSFPIDSQLCKKWQTVLKIGKPITKNMMVCSKHFKESDFFPAQNKRQRLKKGVVPSQKIPKTSHSAKQPVIDRSKRHWLQKYNLNLASDESMEEESIGSVEGSVLLKISSGADSVDGINIAEPSTSKGFHMVSHKEPLPDVFYKDQGTETEVCDFFELPQILNSDEKLMSFTGINFDTLTTITKCAEKTASYNNCHWTNTRERIILVLCKLKLSISCAALSVLFRLTKSQCTNLFYSTVSLLAVALKPAIYWPSKEEILKNMPKCFEQFKNTRVVLDCTEIKIQKLKCLKCRVRSYSHYKGTHTIKYLIGITPSGLISIVSAGFGGRSTDKAIFNYENILDKVDMQDAIMVDKGFLIEQECNEKLVKLIRPPFLKKQKQLSKEDAETTGTIARATVHVERAIQRIKLFRILHEQFDWYLIPYVDEIMTIIAAIVNLSPPILADIRIHKN